MMTITSSHESEATASCERAGLLRPQCHDRLDACRVPGRPERRATRPAATTITIPEAYASTPNASIHAPSGEVSERVNLFNGAGMTGVQCCIELAPRGALVSARPDDEVPVGLTGRRHRDVDDSSPGRRPCHPDIAPPRMTCASPARLEGACRLAYACGVTCRTRRRTPAGGAPRSTTFQPTRRSGGPNTTMTRPSRGAAGPSRPAST